MSEKDLEKTLKVLANRRRLLVLKILNNQNEMSVGDIAEKMKLSFKATSKHLGLLYSANFIDREQRNLKMFYKIDSNVPQLVKNIINLL